MDIWKDAKKTLATVAPMLATAVGGPLAGAATNAIIAALGLAADTTQEQAATVVTGATADQLIVLRNADHDFSEKMAQLQIDTAKLSFDDKADARAREIAVKDKTPAALAFVLTGGFFGLLTAMMFHAVPAGSEQVLNVMVGALGASFTVMVAYYYGASVTPSAGK